MESERTDQLCHWCSETKTLDQFPTSVHKRDGSGGCVGTSTCFACWSEHIDERLYKFGIDGVICMWCGTDLPELVVAKLAIPAVYEICRRQVVRTRPGYFQCTRVLCTYGHVVSPADEAGNVFLCGDCGLRSCMSCDAPMHDAETCSTYQARMRLLPTDAATRDLLDRKTKLCPNTNCGARIKNKWDESLRAFRDEVQCKIECKIDSHETCRSVRTELAADTARSRSDV